MYIFTPKYPLIRHALPIPAYWIHIISYPFIKFDEKFHPIHLVEPAFLLDLMKNSSLPVY